MYNLGMHDNENACYQAFKREVLHHSETKAESTSRLKSLQFQLVENAQLHRELEAARELIDSIKLSTDSKNRGR